MDNQDKLTALKVAKAAYFAKAKAVASANFRERGWAALTESQEALRPTREKFEAARAEWYRLLGITVAS